MGSRPRQGKTCKSDLPRLVRDGLLVLDENLGGKGELKVKMVLTAEGTGLEHIVEGTIDLG